MAAKVTSFAFGLDAVLCACVVRSGFGGGTPRGVVDGGDVAAGVVGGHVAAVVPVDPSCFPWGVHRGGLCEMPLSPWLAQMPLSPWLALATPKLSPSPPLSSSPPLGQLWTWLEKILLCFISTSPATPCPSLTTMGPSALSCLSQCWPCT